MILAILCVAIFGIAGKVGFIGNELRLAAISVSLLFPLSLLLIPFSIDKAWGEDGGESSSVGLAIAFFFERVNLCPREETSSFLELYDV